MRCFKLFLLFALASTVVEAAPVTTFRTFKATPATILSGQGTDDPLVGGLGPNETASNAFVLGYFASPFSLVNVGDQIIFTFGVTFNDAVGVVNSNDNFRFALFDLNGETPVTTENSPTAGVDGQTDNFRGYIFGVKTGTGTGSIRERIDMLGSGDNTFATAGANGASAPSLGPVGGDPVVIAGSVNGNGAGPLYSGMMTLTLTASGVDLSGSFIGSNNATGNLFTASDTATPFPTTFGAIGFLLGGGLSVDQAQFSDVTVSFVPEPATVSFMALGSLLTLGRRRRQ